MFGRRSHREKVGNRGAGRAIGKGSRKGRFALARKVSEGGVTNFVEVGRAFKGAVENTPTDADASVPGLAKNLAEQTIIVTQRIGQSQARSEIIPTDRRQRLGDVRITWENPAGGRARENHRLLTRNQRLELIELGAPRGADVVADSIIES